MVTTADAFELPQALVTVTLYVPEVLAVINWVVSPFDQAKVAPALPASNVTVPPHCAAGLVKVTLGAELMVT